MIMVDMWMCAAHIHSGRNSIMSWIAQLLSGAIKNWSGATNGPRGCIWPFLHVHWVLIEAHQCRPRNFCWKRKLSRAYNNNIIAEHGSAEIKRMVSVVAYLLGVCINSMQPYYRLLQRAKDTAKPHDSHAKELIFSQLACFAKFQFLWSGPPQLLQAKIIPATPTSTMQGDSLKIIFVDACIQE